ncbi:STAS domain-containing protein [Actinoplanes philippinensis]|uniref:STAS domain-containing protein n=1 Tax=Actinoplanes philippinensis TaxID=35752 RepID=UPI0033F7D03E
MTGPAEMVRDVAGARVVVLPADLDQSLAERLRPALIEAAEAGRDLVIDMGDATTIDPAGLGLLVRAHRAARQHDATLCLVAPSRFVLTVLHTMRLDGVFPIFPDQRTALSGPIRPAAMA